MNMRSFFHSHFIVAVILCPLLFGLTSTMEFHPPNLLKPAEYQLSPQFFKFISFGFWPATADLLWMQTLQKVGVSNYSEETLPDTLGFYRLATALDPNFYEIYDQAAVVFGFYYEAVTPALEIIDRGLSVYEAGTVPQKFWSHAYSLYLYRAYINAFLKNDWVQAKSDYLKAAYSPGAPNYLQNMKIWLKEEGSEKKLAIRVLKLSIQNAKDPVVKAKYLEKLKHYE